MLSLRATNGVAVPASVRHLMRQSDLPQPYSLRALIRQQGRRGRQVKVALLRYSWQVPARPGPQQWTDDQVKEVFAAENCWSASQYWWRGTLGLVELVFDVYPWRALPGVQSVLDTTRGSVNTLVRAQAAADGVPLSNYQQTCTVIQPPPGDRGALGAHGDVVVDEAPFSLEFFEHELGHLIGYEHSFGLRASDGTWQAYLDDFDVMGYSKDNDRGIPVGIESLPLPAGTNFWRSGRRLSAASLYRYEPVFAASGGVVRIPAGTTQSIRLLALTRGRFGDPVLAVAGTPTGEVTAEYRTSTEDDLGIGQAPAVVLHSIGRRPLPQGAHEVNPVVYEAFTPALVGSEVTIAERDVTARVTSVSGDAIVIVISNGA